MKKKNTFKNKIVQNEDGTRSYKNENLWMHSVERPVSDNEIAEIVKAFAMLIGMGVLMLIAFCIVGGGC